MICGQFTHDRVFYCTEEHGHAGPHVAQDPNSLMGMVWAVWGPGADTYDIPAFQLNYIDHYGYGIPAGEWVHPRNRRTT